MGNKKWTRVLALVMALVCTLTVVGALELSDLDQNGDGKITVWDLQVLFNAEKAEEYEAAVKEVLGGNGDELNPVRYDGEVPVYEIYTELGLRNMVKNATKGYIFELQKDIDLGGKDWTPVKEFIGILDGGNYKIHNFTISKSSGQYMGFFEQTQNKVVGTATTEIRNLHMEDVTLIVAADENTTTNVRFVAPIVGNNRGNIVNCSTISTVVDKRTNLPKSMYYGTLVGNHATKDKLDENGQKVLDENEKVVKVCVGTINCSNAMTAQICIETESAKKVTLTDQPVNSKMATQFAVLESTSAARKMGIAGSSQSDGYSGDTGTGLLWQDISNSSDLVDSEVRARREEVVRYMYEMCTVQWKVTTVMKYYKNKTMNGDTRAVETYYLRYDTDKPGAGGWSSDPVVYRGIPYNHGSSSLERFEAYMTDTGSSVLTANHSLLPTEAYYYNNENTAATEARQALQAAYTEYHAGGTTDERKTELETEWPELKLMTANIDNAHQVGFNMYIGTDCSSAVDNAWRRVSSSVVSEGGANAHWTNYFFPTETLVNTYGLRTVNGLMFTGDLKVTIDGQEVDMAEDYSSTNAQKAAFITAYYADNKDYYYETLGCTSMGDVLVGFSSSGGHAIMAASDAVVIKNYAGKIDTAKSYILTHEQGANAARSGGTKDETIDGKSVKVMSSCATNYKWSFADLSVTSASNPASSAYKFVPVSMDALHEKNTDAAVAWCKMENNVITSNFHIISTTVGNDTVYTQIKQSGHRYSCLSLTKSELETAYGKSLDGATVTVNLSNGQPYTFTFE